MLYGTVDRRNHKQKYSSVEIFMYKQHSEVEPRGFEPLTYAVQKRTHNTVVVRGCSGIPAKSIFSPKGYRTCLPLFAWVAARLLHAGPIANGVPSYLHIYPILLHVVLPTVLVRVRNGPSPQFSWIRFHLAA